MKNKICPKKNFTAQVKLCVLHRVTKQMDFKTSFDCHERNPREQKIFNFKSKN